MRQAQLTDLIQTLIEEGQDVHTVDVYKGWTEVDTFDGSAWVGLIPFSMRRIGLSHGPAVPYFGSFAEVNVRTYVIAGGRPGVWFFSLDVDRLLHHITALPRGDRWTSNARSALRSDLYAALAGLTAAALRAAPAGTGLDQRIASWEGLLAEWPAVAAYQQTLSVAVNAEYARMDTPLREGDEVAFLPPVSGGTGTGGDGTCSTN